MELDRRHRRRLPLIGALVALWLALIAGPAAAVPPFAMSGPVEDSTEDQVTAGQTDAIEAARDRVLDATDFDLWVVYVDSFDDMNALAWANQTARQSSAGTDVLLLAVAVGDVEVAVSADEEAALSDGDLTRIERDAVAALDDGPVAAAEAAADAVLASAGVSTDGGQQGSGGGALGPLIVIVIVVGAVLAIVGLVSARRRARGGGAAAGSAPGQLPPRPRTPADEFAQVSTADLGTRAGSALVELDNDVRSSSNELGFAEAQFGIDATRDFKDALTQAQTQLGEAFGIQQQLDGAPDEQARRAALIRILLVCREAEATLDAQTEAMATLRRLQERAPEVLSELAERADEIEARIPPARATLEQLRATFPASALTSVAQAPDQATALIEAAERAVAEGRARVEAGDRGTAVAFARTAEDALQQVGTLLETVAHARTTLEEAGGRLDASIASVTTDLADAGRLGVDDGAVTSAAERARTAVSAGEAARDGGDPIAAVAELVSAEQALDAALAPHREAEESHRRAGGRLGSAMAVAEAAVRRADDYISTHRGGVGEAARTRASAAGSALAQARALGQQQPVDAVAAAESATRQADEAIQIAEADVTRWQSRSVGSGGGYYGRSGGIDTTSLVLGGLLGQVLGGSGGGHSRRSSWGGSSWGGGGWGGSSGGWGGSSSRSSSGRRSSVSRPRRSSSGGRSRRSGGGRSRR